MIALITDFGYHDYFVGVLKGVIRKINPEVEIVDISHGVKSFSVVNAQFILYSSYRHFPSGTIFCVVVDPGVGTERRGLIAQGRDYCYVLPDNGILSAAISSVSEVYTIADDFFENSSPTFHGRDVFAPVSARIAKGQRPDDLGYRIHDFIEKKFPDYKLHDSGFSGLVAHIDTFGNVVLPIPNRVIDDDRIYFVVSTGKFKFQAVACKTYGELKQSQIGLIKGSSGFIELAIRGDSLAGQYEIHIEDDVVITYDR